MQYLKNALELKQLINQANDILLELNKKEIKHQNFIFLNLGESKISSFPMDEYTNEFVSETIKQNAKAECMLMTDVAKMEVQGKELYYYMYKAYHKNLEKGLVFYQVFDPKTLKPQGVLQFSSLEENIFYTIDAPSFEESSCNAMETGEQSATDKNIAFLIGHTNEERLLYDIERLIFDTINNVQKNPKVKFRFIIQVSLYGGSISEALKAKVSAIGQFVQKELKNEYTNTTFTFDYE